MDELKDIFNKINNDVWDGMLPEVTCGWMSPAEHKEIAQRIGLPAEKVLFGFCYGLQDRIVVNEIIKKAPELVHLVMEHEMEHLAGIVVGFPMKEIDYMSGEFVANFLRYKLEFLRKHG